jgi:hypothetical protein
MECACSLSRTLPLPVRLPSTSTRVGGSAVPAVAEIPVPEQFRRRVQAVAVQYQVPQPRIQELAAAIGSMPGRQQTVYVAGWTHAVMLSVIERHAGCQEPDCGTCADFTDILAMLMAAEELRLDEAFDDIVRDALGAEARRQTVETAAGRTEPSTPVPSTGGEQGARAAACGAAPPDQAPGEPTCIRPARHWTTVPAGETGHLHWNGSRRWPATTARRMAPVWLLLIGVVTAVVVAASTVTAGVQAWRALPALGADSPLAQGVLTGLIALLPTVAAGWAYAPWRERLRWQRRLALAVGGLALVLDFAAWVVYASAEQLPSPWFAAAMFTFIHACGPLTLILFLQGSTSSNDEAT